MPRSPLGDGESLGGDRPGREAPAQEDGTQSVKRIPIHYTYAEPFGEAECVYCFPIDQVVFLTNGGALPAGWLEPAMKFRMEGGTTGTVTAVGEPLTWEPPPPTPDGHGNFRRRVLGTIKHRGIAVIDVSFGGQTITTTADHLFWSVDRGRWFPVGSMAPGDRLKDGAGNVSVIDSISDPRYESTVLYNLEIEEHHTFYVGTREHGSALVHNGEGLYIKKPLRVDEMGNPIPHGFKNAEDYQKFSAKLKSELPPDTQPLINGSSITGFNSETGIAHDVGRISDVDVGLAGPVLFEKARALGLKAKDGTRIGPLMPQDLEALGLSSIMGELSEIVGRPVNFMLFDTIGAGMKRNGLWVP